MAKKVTIVQKEKEKDPQVQIQGLNKNQNDLDKTKDPVSWFKYYENQVINDERFVNASDDEKKKYLSNLYDTYGEPLRANKNISKEDYINGTFSKYMEQGMVEDEKKSPSNLPSIDTTKSVVPQDTTRPVVSGEKSSPIYEGLEEKKKSKDRKPVSSTDPKTIIQGKADQYYKDKGWPLPSWKISEYEKTVADLQAKVQAGEMKYEDGLAKADEIINTLGLVKDKEGKVSVSPTEVAMYREQIDHAYRQYLNEQKEKEKDPFLKDVLDALNIGSNQVMTSPTKFLAVSERIGNGMMRLIGQKDRWGSTYWKDKANVDQAISDQWRESNNRYDAEILEMVHSGDMAGATGKLILSIAENLPMLTTLVIGNTLGLSKSTLAFMGGEKGADEYIRSMDDPTMNEFNRAVNALTKFGSEVVFENMGTMAIISQVRRGVQEAGEKTIRDRLREAYVPYFQRQLSLVMKGGGYGVWNAAEEMATQTTDNLVDIAMGKDVKLMDGVWESGIVGFGIGIGLSSPQIYAEFKGGRNEYVKHLKEIIPESMDFESREKLAELIMEGDQIAYNMKQGGAAAMDMVNKQRLDQIQQEIAKMMGTAPEEEAEIAGEGSKSKVGPLIMPEDLKIDPGYIEWLKEEREFLDTRIKEVQQKFNLPTTPDINIPEAVEETLDKMERGEPIINSRLKETSDLLYGEYKRLNAMKNATKKQYTDEQIDAMLEVLGEDITNLNNLINEQAESGDFQTEEVKLTDEITVSQITEVGEGEAVEGEPPAGEKTTERTDTEEIKPEGPEKSEVTPEEEGTYGKPEKFLQTPAKEFNQRITEEQDKADVKAAEVEERIRVLNERKEALKGRLTTEQRNLKRGIEDDIIRAEREIEAIDEEFYGPIKEYLGQAQPEMDRTIQELLPDTSTEQMDAIRNELWNRITNPKTDEEDLSIGDILLKIIDEKATKGEGTVPRVPPRTEEQKPTEQQETETEEEALKERPVFVPGKTVETYTGTEDFMTDFINQIDPQYNAYNMLGLLRGDADKVINDINKERFTFEDLREFYDAAKQSRLKEFADAEQIDRMLDYVSERVKVEKPKGETINVKKQGSEAYLAELRRNGTMEVTFPEDVAKQITENTGVKVYADPVKGTISLNKPEEGIEPVFPEGYKPTIVERKQNWRYTVYQPDGESEASSLTLRKEPVETEDGKLLSVGILSTVTGEGGKGLGTNLMKYAMANLPQGIDGLIIPDGTITNTVQVPRILETMKKIYDVTEKPNGDIIIKNRPGMEVKAPVAPVSTKPKPQGQDEIWFIENIKPGMTNLPVMWKVALQGLVEDVSGLKRGGPIVPQNIDSEQDYLEALGMVDLMKEFAIRNMEEARDGIQKYQAASLDVREDYRARWEAVANWVDRYKADWERWYAEEFKGVKPEERNAEPVLTDAQKWREAGERTINGVKYKRQPEIKKMKQGKPTDIQFAQKLFKKGHYAIIEAKDLQPSHFGSSPNPKHFIPEAQPRNRGGLESLKYAEIDKGEHLDPRQVGVNLQAYSGAPIVNKRGEVIQGSGRAQGILYYVQKYTTDPNEYIPHLLDIASITGLDVAEIQEFKEPVLVRVLDVPDEEAITLGNYSSTDIEDVNPESADIKKISNRVKREDAIALSNILFKGSEAEDTLNSMIRKNADDLVKKLAQIGVFSQGEAEKFYKKGEVSPLGIQSIERVFKSIFFQGGNNNLPDIFESFPDHVKKGMEKSIAILLRLPQNKNILPQVLHAMMGFHQYQKYMEGVGQAGVFYDWVNQGNIFEGEKVTELYNPFHLAVIEKLTKAKRQIDIVKLFRDYEQAVLGKGEDLFEGPQKGMSRNEAVQQVFGVEYKADIDDEYANKEEVPAEREGQEPTQEPKEGEGTEEISTPEIKIVEVKKDLDDMKGLLDDLDFDDGQNQAAGETGDLDARTKMLNIANRLIDKMVKAEIYSFDKIIAEILPAVEMRQLERLLPFLKQGYSAYWATAPDEIGSKMDIAKAKSYDATDLDKLVASLNKPDSPDDFSDIADKRFFVPSLGKWIEVQRIETWDDPRDQKIEMMGGLFGDLPAEFEKIDVAILRVDPMTGKKIGIAISKLREQIDKGDLVEVPKYDNPEYRAELQKIIDFYKSIGDIGEAAKLERQLWKEPKRSLKGQGTWQQEIEILNRSVDYLRNQQEILSGKIMFASVPEPPPLTMQDLFDQVESMVNRGIPITPFIEKYVPKETLNKILDLNNKLQKFYATLGMLRTDIPRYLEKFHVSGAIVSMYPVGSKARAFELGHQGATKEKVLDAVKTLQEDVKRQYELFEYAKEAALNWDVKNHILNALPLENWLDLVRLAKKWGIESKAAIRDQYELAMVEMAKTIARNGNLSIEDKWTQIYNLYMTSPKISQSARTNEVKELQQYSTPIPIALLMGEYVNIAEASHVIEPSAGMGALLIGANTKAVRANEIDPRRFDGLMKQGYRVINNDSTHGLANLFEVKTFPALVMNPPFGGPKESYNGYPLRGEYVPVAYNLEHLSDTGKAAIIVGGEINFRPDGRMTEKDQMFFNWLYKYFNVEDVIQVPGKFYERMGASYPVKIILINGRKAAPEGAAPLYNDSFKPIEEWSELKNRILNATSKAHDQNILQPKVDAERGDDTLVGRPDPGRLQPEQPIRDQPVVPGKTPGPPGERAGRGERGPGNVDVRPDPNTGRRRDDATNNEPPSIPKPEGGVEPQGGSQGARAGLGFGEIHIKRNREDLPVNNIGKPTERTQRELGLSERTGDEVTPYVPLSQMGSGNFITPASIATEVESALMELRDEVGDVDEYVRTKLKYPSKEAMKDPFFAEQVDGVAQTIFNIESGNAMIIGHQTGTGKGRIAAATIRYAIENGKMPVFITKSADLFTDMFRDLIDIGSPNYVPFIMNKQFASTGAKVKIFDPDGVILHEVDPDENDRIIGTPTRPGTGVLPEKAQVVFTTYSQFTTEDRDAAKRDFLIKLAREKDVVFIMDESHDASGASNTGQFFMNWLHEVGGGLFLSATYAKRPDNMPLYAMKTVLREANMEWDQLVDAIKQGGGALQEIITMQLAQAGQFSKIGFKMDAEMNYLILGDDDATQRTYNPELGKKMVEQYDGVTSILKQIIDFQKVFVNTVLDGMDQDIKKGGGRIEGRKGTSQAGISNTPYFSRIWNILDQLLVSIKVKDTLPLVIEDLKKGLKPVIVVKSTMEAMFDQMVTDSDLQKGDVMDLDFASVLKRGMDTVMKYTVKDEKGQPEYKKLTPEDLTPLGRQMYYSMMEKIQKISTGIPLSPIDVLRQGIKDAGYESVEITGRSTMFKLNREMTKGEYATNDRGDKIKAIKKFNNNPGIVAILNRSGSTGISMHSAARFGDHSQRAMYLLQNDLDINVVVQTLGRVYRADQLNKPIYNILTTTLPAEMRMFMMNARKLKSLDANTSGNQKQSKNLIDVPDFLNKYGDEAVIEFLKENPDINLMIDDPCDVGSDEPKKTNAAHRVTYRVQILPSFLQTEFNNDVKDRYERLIEYLNSTGRNDLMVTSEDLEAEIKESETVINGHGGWSAFGDDTILNVVDANVTRKPYTKKELDEELAKIPENHVEEIAAALEAGMDARLTDQIAKVNTEYEDLRQMWKKRIADKEGLSVEDKEREYNLKLNDLNQREENRILGLKATFEANKEAFLEYLDYFTPGMPVYVPFSDAEQTDMLRTNLGVFLGFDVNMNKANPWIPSNFVMKFATTDSRKVVRIPASKSNHIGSIMHNSRRIDSRLRQDLIDNWDSHQSQRARETRYIITQNILQGLNIYKQGRLIQFTKNDGTLDKGILMNENWIRAEERIARMPIGKAADVIRALPPGEFVESWGGDIIIKKLYEYDPERFYELRVPASTKRGDKFYTNDSLKSIVGLFEQHGDRMVGKFRDSQLEELLGILNDRFKITLEVDSKNVQKAMDQTDSHNAMASWGQPARKKAKIRGLSNPHNDVLGAEEKRVGTRVPPAPITGEKPKKMWEIQYDLTKAEGHRLRYARKPSGNKAIGAYYPGTGKLVIKWHGDLNTTAHEMGHAIDDMFGLVGPEAQAVWGDLKNELSQLWEFGSEPPKGHPNPEQYRMMEGMAEFIRAFAVNPFETQTRFPFTYSWVKNRVSQDPEAWEGLLQFSRDIRIWWGATAAEEIGSWIHMGPPPKSPTFVWQRENDRGQFQLTSADRFARKYTNFFRPWEQAYRWALGQRGIDINTLSPLQNWEFLSRLLLGQDVKMRNAMEHGIVDFEGQRVLDSETGVPLSFHYMLSQIPNHTWKDTEKNLEEAVWYGMAERIKEIPWKIGAHQIRMDLNTKGDHLPSPRIMRKYPHLLDQFAAKFRSIEERINKGELDPDDVYLPDERYDFTDMVIAGIAQEGMRDYDIAVKAVAELDQMKRTNPDKHKWISEFNRIYREIGANIIKYARDSNLISDAAFEQIDYENLYYMAMKRLFVMDPSEIVEGIAQDGIHPLGLSDRDSRGLVRIVIHPIKGSRREIRNPVEALMESYYQVVRNGDLNYSIVQLAKAFNGGRDPYMEQLVKVGEVAWVSKTPEQRSIPFFVNGKKKYFVIPDPEMFELFKNFIPNSGKSGPIVDFLSWLPQKLRSSIIMAPVFAARNVIRDFRHFLVLGRAIRYLRPVDFLPNKKMRHAFETTGGGQFGYLTASKRGYYELMRMAMFKVSEDPKKWLYGLTQVDPEGKIIKTKAGPAAQTIYENTFGVMMQGERLTRMLQFKAAVREGMAKVKVKEPTVDADGNVTFTERTLTEQEAIIRAAYLSRDLMDFMVGGTVIRELNKVIIFLNPAIRGLDRIARSIKDPKQRASVLLRMGVILAIPGILNSVFIALFGSDDEKEEYLSAPDYERDMFDRIPMGLGWVMIPRPFELSAISSIFQRATDRILLGDTNAFSETYFKSLGHLISPVDVAGLLGGYSGVIGALFNRDFFRQKHIIPPEDVDISIALRNTEYASQFSRLVQEASDLLTKKENHYLLDARKVDAFIQGQFSYYGNAFLKATEVLIPGEGQGKFTLDITSTGFYRYANAYAEPNTQWLLGIYKQHPYLKTRIDEEYKPFSFLIQNYFSEEVQRDKKKKREVGKALREFSAARREAWKNINFYNEDLAVKQIQDAKRSINN